MLTTLVNGFWLLADGVQIEGPCVTEDTALAFTALNGLPGPYIKDFMGAVGHEGELLHCLALF